MSIVVLRRVFELLPSAVKPSERLVLLALAQHAHDDGGGSWPSVRAIVRETSLARGTVQRILRALQAKKLIAVDGTAEKGSTIYRLNVPGLTVRPLPGPIVRPPRPHGEAPPASPRHTPGLMVRPELSLNSPLTVEESSAGDSAEGKVDEKTSAQSSAFLVFPAIGTPKTWTLTAAQIAQWVPVYPTLDVRQECRQASAWLQANPSRRKSASGMPAFLVSWLGRSAARQREVVDRHAREPRSNVPSAEETDKYLARMRAI